MAVFEGREVKEHHVFQTLPELADQLNALGFESSIISSVLSPHETQLLLNQLLFDPLVLTSDTLIPITNKYENPESLGKDRLANACFTKSVHENKNKLVIDAGTCLKFDFVNENNEYWGGSIGPGLEMRYKALNNYTGNLPLVFNEEEYQNLMGNNTQTSILSGVKIGMQEEINGLIRQYEAKYKDLTIFITGGDLDKFELKSKNTIFADQLITLKGLNEILLFNI